MEAGVAVASRSSFRKPSQATSQRNYRRRSPSSSSRSPSGSPSPPPAQAASGGWKRDRSASLSSPKRDGGTNAPIHSKEGKTGKDASDEDSQDRLGEPGPGSSERHGRGESYDRYGRPDFYESRRSKASHYDRNYQTYGRHTSRDSYGSTRRNGDYDRSLRSRQSPDRGYRNSSKSRDRERRRRRDRDRDVEGHPKYRTGRRETNLDREADLEGRIDQDSRERYRDGDRDRDRDRNRDRSRGRRNTGRDLYSEKDDDVERRYGGGRSRDSNRNRDRDRERVRSRHTPREHSVGREFEAGEIDSERSREERDLDRGRDEEKLQSKSDVRDFDHSEALNRESTERNGRKGKETEREKLKDKVGNSDLNNDMDIETQRDTLERPREGRKYRDRENSDLNSDMDIDTQRGTLDRTREGRQYKDRERADDKGGQDLNTAEMKSEKDVDRSRDKSRGRDADRPRDRDDCSSDRRRNYSRQADGDDNIKARDFESDEQSKENRRKDGDEQRERGVHRDKDYRVRDKDYKVRDRPREKDGLASVHEYHKSSNRSDNERSGNKSYGTSEQSKHRDRDRGNSSGWGKGSGHDKRVTDGAWDKEKSIGKSDKEKHQGTRGNDVDGSSKREPRDREGSRDRNHATHDQESGQLASSLPPATVSDTKVTAGSDGKSAKGSKWGPEASDSTIKSSASEELANDLTAAKLAAMKAAELVNKNLGVAGFMSADQKKRLLWGSKKLAAEQPMSIQEPAATGSNRWDTVHFSDRDRQEKFHKLMGVKADTCTESKKEGDPEAGVFTEERQRELQQDLEKQFAAGLRRRDGGKVGLGL